MFAIIVFIGIGVLLLYLSKGLKKLSAWLTTLSQAMAPDKVDEKEKIITHNKSNKQILQQNKIAEEQLQFITGETSYAAYSLRVRDEIEGLIKEVNSGANV